MQSSNLKELTARGGRVWQLAMMRHFDTWGSLVANMKLKGYDGTLAFGPGEVWLQSSNLKELTGGGGRVWQLAMMVNDGI